MHSFHELLESLLKYSQEQLGYSQSPIVKFVVDENNASNPLGKTGYYDPNEQLVVIYTTGRHNKDILRSLSHELVHHNQNCQGQFDKMGMTNEGYAQTDSHLREMEREAYERGNLIFRDWEDGLKQSIKEATNMDEKQLRQQIREAIVRALSEGEEMTEEQIQEAIDGKIDHPEKVEDPDKPRGHGLGGLMGEERRIAQKVLKKDELFAPHNKEHLTNKRVELNEQLMKKWVK